MKSLLKEPQPLLTKAKPHSKLGFVLNQKLVYFLFSHTRSPFGNSGSAPSPSFPYPAMITGP